ncbi:hypothetical protein [Devosia sp. 2618]|uniref:hypothetical protein n=1 Tax=Devosia sp. 2618 TaxID=3156454 RepID=UPI00339B3D5C
MALKIIGKLAATMLLGGALAGCIDVNVDVEVTSETTAKARLTQLMSADFYEIVQQDQGDGEEGSENDGFCDDGELTENADGSASCVITEEGAFADLTLGDDNQSIKFTSAGPGLVRVALPTEDMRDAMDGEGMDADSLQMVEAFFTGHAMTMRFSGLEVVDTNMTLSADKKSAETSIPFVDFFKGELDLPDEIYAVVRVK